MKTSHLLNNLSGILMAVTLLWSGNNFLFLGPFAFFGLCGLTYQLVLML